MAIWTTQAHGSGCSSVPHRCGNGGSPEIRQHHLVLEMSLTPCWHLLTELTHPSRPVIDLARDQVRRRESGLAQICSIRALAPEGWPPGTGAAFRRTPQLNPNAPPRPQSQRPPHQIISAHRSSDALTPLTRLSETFSLSKIKQLPYI